MSTVTIAEEKYIISQKAADKVIYLAEYGNVLEKVILDSKDLDSDTKIKILRIIKLTVQSFIKSTHDELNQKLEECNIKNLANNIIKSIADIEEKNPQINASIFEGILDDAYEIGNIIEKE